MQHLASSNATTGQRFFNSSMEIVHKFLGLPSRAFMRMRRLDNMLNQDAMQTQAQPFVSTSAQGMHTAQARAATEALYMPGPWGFMTSGYCFGMLIMALILNRIQNVVAPSRHPLFRHHRRAPAERHGLLRSLRNTFFPIDLSSTFARSTFRIPSIYLLGKALLIWFVVLLQVSNLYSASEWRWLQALGDWVARKPMEEICWFTFTSVCVALCVGTLTRGLDGFNINSNSPTNLFGFAFQLYLFSAEYTHSRKSQDHPSRPDKHTVVTLILPLLQLMMIHCLEVRQRWARQRLIPTTVCALLALGHFHTVIWRSPSSYPLSNVFPCVVESLLLGTIMLTILLNLITQLVLEGTISRPLFGHTQTLLPKWDEDFGVALIRLGAASFEATSVAGLGNEVAAVTSASSSHLIQHGHSSPQGSLELDRAGVISINTPEETSRKRSKKRVGFANEITNVKVHALTVDTLVDSMVYLRWYKELWHFVLSGWAAVRRLLRRLWSCLRGACRATGAAPSVENDLPINPTAPTGEKEEDELDVVYERFLRGDALSDDDDEFDPFSDRPPTPESPASTSDGEMSEEVAEDSETVQLYADLSTDTATSSSAPLLLAHMVNTSTSPLTRLRYRRLVRAPVDQQDTDDWQSFALSRRQAKAGAPPDELDERRRNCVVCTVEPREVICWPCRCLALCNDCRENLASRSSASKHTCPCCRTSVQGYSRIYIP
ncbi:hypothetical protein CERSUDRAFT_113400 [Gelatoporia subvermispora B]|uniref:RING-type domain-containing protein n=1 Tax=Ceriporiopsis subvermispora (strain B) TaxID=914234 RepID=M2RID8_CERS8|nr:hypothetical protein CERSUDRAFT_113400 [Gelatoporia subvermispora B]